MPEFKPLSIFQPLTFKRSNVQTFKRLYQRSNVQTFFSDQRRAWRYLAVLVLAECLATWVSPTSGLVVYSLALLVLLLHAAVLPLGFQQRFLVALSLVPLTRILSYSMPLGQFPLVYRYGVIGIPLFTALTLAARTTKLSRGMLGLKTTHFFFQILVALTGIGFGWVEYQLLQPEALITELSWGHIWLPALVLLVFTGLLEELVFRGALQYAALRILRRWGLVYVAFLFAVMHLGYGSAWHVTFIFAVGLFYGFVTLRSGSILGVALSHGLTNVALYLVFPLLLVNTPNLLPSPGDLFNTLTATKTPSPTQPATATITPSATSPSPTATPLATQTSTSLPTSQPSNLPTPALSRSEGFQPSNLLVDDTDPGFSLTGSQTVSSSDATGGSFHLAPATDQIDQAILAQWAPDLTVCGRYKVEVYIPGGYPTVSHFEYQIGYRDGMVTVSIDPSAHLGEWVDLGSYDLLPNQSATLYLSNLVDQTGDSEGYVLFDAARWTLLSPCK